MNRRTRYNDLSIILCEYPDITGFDVTGYARKHGLDEDACRSMWRGAMRNRQWR